MKETQREFKLGQTLTVRQGISADFHIYIYQNQHTKEIPVLDGHHVCNKGHNNRDLNCLQYYCHLACSTSVTTKYINSAIFIPPTFPIPQWHLYPVFINIFPCWTSKFDICFSVLPRSIHEENLPQIHNLSYNSCSLLTPLIASSFLCGWFIFVYY